MRIKVLHIITRLDKGGSATNTLETVARLNKERYEVTLVSGSTEDPAGSIADFIKERKINCIFVHELKRSIKPWSDFKAFIKLYQIIKKGQYDIVHTHSSKAGILGRWAAWLVRTKIIVHTPHGHVFYGYFNKFVTWILIVIERVTALVTHKIITLTHQGKKDHIDFKIGPEEKFVPIYSGIDIDEFQSNKEQTEELRKHLMIPQEDKIVGMVARLDPVKGVEYFVEATFAVLRNFPQTSFVIAGDGSERHALEAQAKILGINQKFRFLGFRNDVTALISVMDIVVLSSLNEGMGRAILEAMACGKAVVATKVGGVPELVVDGQTGLLVPPADSELLAKAIEELLADDDKRIAFGQEAKKQVTEKYSIEKMITDIDNLYSSLLR